MPQCDALACGADPACGESCGDCEPNETCLDDGAYCGAEYGYGDDFGYSNLANPDVMFGHRFTLPVAATLERFGVLAGAAGNVRMALYTHDGGGPAALVAQSGEFAVLAGSNEHAVAEVALVPGDYWIAIVLEASTSLRSTDLDDDAHEMFYALMSYDSAFPASSTSDALINSVLFNLYVVVDDG